MRDFSLKNRLFNFIEDAVVMRRMLQRPVPEDLKQRVAVLLANESNWNTYGLSKQGIEEYELILTEYGLHQSDGRLPAFDELSSKMLRIE